jgi:DnaK suppressor protein
MPKARSKKAAGSPKRKPAGPGKKKTGRSAGSASGKTTKTRPSSKATGKARSTKKVTKKSTKAKKTKKAVATKRVAKTAKPSKSKRTTKVRVTKKPVAKATKTAKKKKTKAPKKKVLSSAERAARRRKLRQFRGLLLDKHKSLLQAYNSTRGDARNPNLDGTEDYIDYAVSSYSRDFMLSLTEMERRQLTLVEEALRRIEQREYGRCLNCSQEIPEKRLEVEPWARHCIRCQELEEQGLLTEAEFADDEEADEADEEFEFEQDEEEGETPEASKVVAEEDVSP